MNQYKYECKLCRVIMYSAFKPQLERVAEEHIIEYGHTADIIEVI
jgi:hypothetical protein